MFSLQDAQTVVRLLPLEEAELVILLKKYQKKLN